MAMPSGLTTRYKCDQTSGTQLTDSISTNHGTLIGSGIGFVFDKNVNRYVLAKDSDNDETYISIPLLTTTKNYSIGFWKKFTDTESMVWYLRFDSINSTSYTIWVTETFIRIQRNTSPWVGYKVRYTLEKEYNHFLFTIKDNGNDTGEIKFYLNGNLIGTHTIAIGVWTTGTPSSNLLLSQKSNSNLWYHGSGRFIEFTFFNNKVLTDAEVKQVYDETYIYLRLKKYSIFDDCVAYYDFSKNALDVIGENNGTVSGATLTTNHLNQSNSAYSFDGTDDWIDCGNFDPSTNRQYLSVFSWIKTNFNQSRTVIGRWSASGDPSGNLAAPRLWAISVNDTGVVSIVISNNGKYNGAVQKSYNSIDSFNDNTWHFVGFTWSNGTFKLFVDGIELTGSNLNKVQDDSFTQHYDASTKVRIGAYGNHVDAPAAFFNGSINLPMCFNKALSVDEVKQLYDLTKNKVIHPIVRGGRE